MARHSELRFDVGHQIAALAVTILSGSRTLSPVEKEIRQEIANAAGYFNVGDFTELSRSWIHAHSYHASKLAKPRSGKYAAALSMFGGALVDYARGKAPDYIPALEKARKAVELAKACNT